MKIPIDEVAVIDLDAPVLSAYEAKYRGVVRWCVWCKHCREWQITGRLKGTGRHTAGTRAARTGKAGTICRMLGSGGTGRRPSRFGVAPMPGLEKVWNTGNLDLEFCTMARPSFGIVPLNDENNEVRSRDRCLRKPCPLGQLLCAY